MKVERVADMVKNGDVLLYRGTKPHSRFIRWWTQSVYSHVGMAIWVESPPGHKRLCVIEALEPGGVRVAPIEHSIEGCQVDWYPIDPSQTNGDDAVRYCLSKWMQRYSAPRQFLRSYSLIWSHIARYYGLKADVGYNRFHCSELVTAALVAAGYNDHECPEPPRSTPGDVALYTCVHREGRIEI